jgi:hypothetical protein
MNFFVAKLLNLCSFSSIVRLKNLVFPNAQASMSAGFLRKKESERWTFERALALVLEVARQARVDYFSYKT